MRYLLLLAAIAACDTPPKEDFAKEAAKMEADKPPPPPTTKPKEVARKAKTPDELGTCHLTATGSVSADQTTKGGKDATNISYWYTEAEQKTMMGVDGFVINCKGPDIKFSLVPGGGKKDGMPFKPKKYDFAQGKGDGVLMISFGPKQTMDKPTGSIDVTSFDSHHIAGTVDLSGTVGSGQVKLAGTFDLICPDLSACEK
ncbi:MAG: hypothetical protein QM831_35300 [Kofleriaceae bacterium]